MVSCSANALLLLAFATPTGLGPTLPHQESVIEGIRSDQYELGAMGMRVGGGAELRILHRLYGMLEYKLTRTSQTVTVASGSGTMRALLVTSHLVFGAAYHF